MFFFFFKQKTAYEMRISDWSSDVCSSDLVGSRQLLRFGQFENVAVERQRVDACARIDRAGDRAAGAQRYAVVERAKLHRDARSARQDARIVETGLGDRSEGSASLASARDRKSSVLGKRVSVRVGLGGGR